MAKKYKVKNCKSNVWFENQEVNKHAVFFFALVMSNTAQKMTAMWTLDK